MRSLCQNPSVTAADHCSDASTLGNTTVLLVENTNYDPKGKAKGVLAEKYQAFVFNHLKYDDVFRSLGIKDLQIKEDFVISNGLVASVFSRSTTKTEVNLGAISFQSDSSKLLKFDSNGLGIKTKKQQKFAVHQKIAAVEFDATLFLVTLDQLLVVEKVCLLILIPN